MATSPCFTHRRRVLFHETDLAGIVHFSNFLKYMEEAEHAFLRSIGFSVHPSGPAGVRAEEGWPRLRAECDYHAPLFFDDEIDIEVHVAEVRDKAVRYRFYIWKNGPDARVKSATGQIVAVHVRADRAAGTIRPVPMPEDLRAQLMAHLAPEG